MNYLDIVLTATESSAGLMCACLPLTKPLVIRFTRWLQSMHGLDTKHQGWTTYSQSGTGEGRKKGIVRVDDYSVQLLRASDPALSQIGTLNGLHERGYAVAECGTVSDKCILRGECAEGNAGRMCGEVGGADNVGAMRVCLKHH